MSGMCPGGGPNPGGGLVKSGKGNGPGADVGTPNSGWKVGAGICPWPVL